MKKTKKGDVLANLHFPNEKLLVPTLSKRLLNLKQTREKRIPTLNKVPDVQRLHISHLLILEFLPEINQDHVLIPCQ